MKKSTKGLENISAKRKKLIRNNMQKKKKLSKGVTVLVVSVSVILAFLFLVIIGIIAYLAITDNNEGFSDVTDNFEIIDLRKHYYDNVEKEYVIEGIITNTTNKTFDDVEIEYYLYNENGVVLSTARSFIDDIGPKERLRFKAISDENINKVYSYDLIRIVEDSNFYNPGSMRVDPIINNN